MKFLIAVITIFCFCSVQASYVEEQFKHELLTTTGPGLSEFERNQIHKVWPDDLRSLAEESPKVKRQLMFDRYGFFEPENFKDGDDSPINLVRTEDNSWGFSCLTCHSGPVKYRDDGQLKERIVIGAPNKRIDFSTIVEDRLELYSQLRKSKVKLPKNYKRSMKSLERLFKIETVNVSRGTIGPWAVIGYLLDVRKKDMKIRKLKLARWYLTGKGVDPLAGSADMDIPAWWTTRYKTHIYADASMPRDEKVPFLGVSTIAFKKDEVYEKVNRMGPKFLEYLDSYEAPEYPFEIDEEMARRGQVVFENQCAKCHGSYNGGHVDYPNKVISIGGVNTDYLRLYVGMNKEFRKKVWEGWFGDFGESDFTIEPEGYLAPPLVGLWASAPYLHNGSVPTLYHVLFPDERPLIWKPDYSDYDDQLVGYAVEEYESLPEVLTNDERRKYFDTRLSGKFNVGHTYADRIHTDAERMDLLEYLKTL